MTSTEISAEISRRVGQLADNATELERAAAAGESTFELSANRARIAARLGELHYCERHGLTPDTPSRYLKARQAKEGKA
jgi:hypothetical protein